MEIGCFAVAFMNQALGTEMPRASTRRAMILTTSTRPSSTSPAAHACRCQSSYGATAYVKIITGSDAVGCLQPGLQNRLLNAVKSRGAVSPATRARASRIAVNMPRYAAFNNRFWSPGWRRSEEHTSELQSRLHLVCRLLPETK